MEKQIYRLVSTYEENKVYLRHDGKLTNKLQKTENGFLFDSANFELYNDTNNIIVNKEPNKDNLLKLKVKDSKEIIDSTLIREYKLYAIEDNVVYVKRNGSLSTPIKFENGIYIDMLSGQKYDNHGYVADHLNQNENDLVLPIIDVINISRHKNIDIFKFFDIIERINRVRYHTINVSFNSDLHRKVENKYVKLVEKCFMLDVPQTLTNLCYFSDNFVYSLEHTINNLLNSELSFQANQEEKELSKTINNLIDYDMKNKSNNKKKSKHNKESLTYKKYENRQKIIDYFVSLVMQLYLKNNVIVDFKLSKLMEEKTSRIGMKLDFIKNLIDQEGDNRYDIPKRIILQLPVKLNAQEILENTVDTKTTRIDNGLYILNPMFVHAFEINNNEIVAIRPINKNKLPKS